MEKIPQQYNITFYLLVYSCSNNFMEKIPLHLTCCNYWIFCHTRTVCFVKQHDPFVSTSEAHPPLRRLWRRKIRGDTLTHRTLAWRHVVASHLPLSMCHLRARKIAGRLNNKGPWGSDSHMIYEMMIYVIMWLSWWSISTHRKLG